MTTKAAEIRLQFGPQTEQINAAIRAIHWANMATIHALIGAWQNTEERQHAFTVAETVLEQIEERDIYEACSKAWVGAMGDLREIFRVWGKPWWATVDVIYALNARGFIGDIFTQQHYDLLTMPWRKTIGRIHPDDIDRPKQDPTND